MSLSVLAALDGAVLAYILINLIKVIVLVLIEFLPILPNTHASGPSPCHCRGSLPLGQRDECCGQGLHLPRDLYHWDNLGLPSFRRPHDHGNKEDGGGSDGKKGFLNLPRGLIKENGPFIRSITL